MLRGLPCWAVCSRATVGESGDIRRANKFYPRMKKPRGCRGFVWGLAGRVGNKPLPLQFVPPRLADTPAPAFPPVCPFPCGGFCCEWGIVCFDHCCAFRGKTIEEKCPAAAGLVSCVSVDVRGSQFTGDAAAGELAASCQCDFVLNFQHPVARCVKSSIVHRVVCCGLLCDYCCKFGFQGCNQFCG